jgi:hypothetical protein
LNIKAVCYWARKQHREGIAVLVNDLNPDVIITMICEMNLNLDRDKEKDDKLFQLGKFEPRKYITWARSFENYLKKMLEGIVSTNQGVILLKTVVRTNHPTDFDSASTLLATQIALLFPSASNDPRNKRKISAVMRQNQGSGMPHQGRGHGNNRNQAGGGGRGGGNGRGGGGNSRNQHPPMMLNGVDVSNPMRNFTSDEWKRLRESGGFLSWLIDHRSRMMNR